MGPVAVVGSFDVPFHHLAFDDARVGSVAPGRVEASPEGGDGVAPGSVSALRGKNRAPVRANVE